MKHFQHLLDRKGKDSKVLIVPSFIPFFLCWSTLNTTLQFPFHFPLLKLTKMACVEAPSPCIQKTTASLSHKQKVLCATMVQDIQHRLSLGQSEVYILQLYTSPCILPYKQTSTQRVSYHISHGRGYIFYRGFTSSLEASLEATHLIVNHFQILDYANS